YYEQSTANSPHPIHGHNGQHCFQEVPVYQSTIRIKFFPHRSLDKTCYIHRQRIKYNSKRTNPEMEVGQLNGIKCGFCHARYQPVDNCECQETIPSQCSYVNVGYDPVRKVRYGIHVL